MLSLDKDQRVGVSDRMVAEVSMHTEEAAADEMERMLSALAKRTRGDDDADATKH